MNEANVRDTKDRILDSAEKLFASQGIEATSLRQITTHAGVNLASVNYHFNSKDELVRSVYVRRIRPMNDVRLSRLSALQQTKSVSLNSLLDAFYEPVLDMALNLENHGISVGQLMGRLYSEPHESAKSIIACEMAETARSFSVAFGSVLPNLKPPEVMWRLHFTIGLLTHTIGAASKIKQLSNGLVDPYDKQEVLRQMKAYASAGLTAPSLEHLS